MYENGGNTTHRFLDGHPQLFVYPFESQLGTRRVSDHLSSMFPLKYRWPEFALDASAFDDYREIIDEEGKVRARTPQVSKFRNIDFDMIDDERGSIYRRIVEREGRSRATNVAAFFRATFEAWHNFKSSGQEEMYVGYSPIIVVDAEKIAADFPNAHIVHIVRNPWSAYAETKKRAVPLGIEHYMSAWTMVQYYAMLAASKRPERVHILRFEDIIADPENVLGSLCDKLALQRHAAISKPSWNSTPIEEVYPWGTIRHPTAQANVERASELDPSEREEITLRARPFLDAFRYTDELS